MTVAELKKYYADLLILQYINRPRARAMIEALVKPVLIDLVPFDVQAGFNVDTAIGVQLDQIGKYAGILRNGAGFSGPITLNDNNYRLLIKLLIIKNSAGSSLSDIQTLLQIFFAGTLFVFDFLDMRIGYYLNSSVVDQDLAQLIVGQRLLPKPMGVQLSSLLYVPITTQFFGFRKYYVPPHNVHPFNTYTTFHTNWPWLTYTNVVNLLIPSSTSLATEGGDILVQEDGGSMFI